MHNVSLRDTATVGALKAVLKKSPIARRVHASLQSRRDLRAARELFVNYEAYVSALEHKGSGTVVLETRDGLRMTIRRNLWDARIIQEVFLQKSYLRHFSLPQHPVVVDIGGYIGDFAVYAATYLGAGHVIVYEPVAENFAVLQTNVRDNGLDGRVTPVNKAEGDSGQIALNVEILDCDEIHASVYPHSDADRRVVPSVALPELLEIHRLESVDLLKIDCEGAEYSIFLNATDEALSRLHNIVFEYHRVDGFEAELDRVLERLRSAGYALHVHGDLVYALRADGTAGLVRPRAVVEAEPPLLRGNGCFERPRPIRWRSLSRR